MTKRIIKGALYKYQKSDEYENSLLDLNFVNEVFKVLVPPNYDLFSPVQKDPALQVEFITEFGEMQLNTQIRADQVGEQVDPEDFLKHRTVEVGKYYRIRPRAWGSKQEKDRRDLVVKLMQIKGSLVTYSFDPSITGPNSESHHRSILGEEVSGYTSK